MTTLFERNEDRVTGFLKWTDFTCTFFFINFYWTKNYNPNGKSNNLTFNILLFSFKLGCASWLWYVSLVIQWKILLWKILFSMLVGRIRIYNLFGKNTWICNTLIRHLRVSGRCYKKPVSEPGSSCVFLKVS